jgi:hypothetical protein
MLCGEKKMGYGCHTSSPQYKTPLPHLFTMDLTIRTLKNTKYTLRVEPSHTIADVKQQCETELKVGDASSLKMIYLGAVLKDEQTVEALSIGANEFLVMMISKKKKKKKSSAATDAKAAPPASSSSSSSSTPAPTTPAPTTTPSAAASEAAPTSSSSALRVLS